MVAVIKNRNCNTMSASSDLHVLHYTYIQSDLMIYLSLDMLSYHYRYAT
jgi:hypothetical protein